MKPRQVQWARVEYQPDLQNPSTPIPLGVIVAEHFPDTRTTGVVIIGRQVTDPKKPPAKLRDAGELGFALLSGWVSNVARDILEASDPEFLPALYARWRWNLYIVEAETIRAAASVSLFELAKRLFAHHVGTEVSHLPIVRKPSPKRRRRPAWYGAEATVAVPMAAAPAQ